MVVEEAIARLGTLACRLTNWGLLLFASAANRSELNPKSGCLEGMRL